MSDDRHASIGTDRAGRDDMRFPVVGIGASAGGLQALESFFSGLPADVTPGMAFVVVQHLAPDHDSILADIIRRYTHLPVRVIEDGIDVLVDHVYVIPPNRDLTLVGSTLQLVKPSAPSGRRLPIDLFFRSLALGRDERAVGVILSGTGSDGAQGAVSISSAGGMIMAQQCDTAEHDGMPRSAIDTGVVDFVLPPDQMVNRIINFLSRTHRRPLPFRVDAVTAAQGDALKKIIHLLHVQTGRDFSLYKDSTIQHRIERRLAILRIDTMEQYVNHLQRTPAEAESLFRDLLIGVTGFFRDPEAFHALETSVIPGIFAGKTAGSAIRVWSVGCSTGEEAYSLAILLAEHAATLKQEFKLQVFASDIDSCAIATARVGLYPASIAGGIPPDRLSRFFTAEPGRDAYRVHNAIRDLVIFSEQDVTRDPPFSRIDLISCRNLLIYMTGELQMRLLSRFHYALNPGGALFLGAAETVGEIGDEFTVTSRKFKLYQRNLSTLAPGPALRGESRLRVSTPRSAIAMGGSSYPKTLLLRELTERELLLHLGAVAALVNRKGDILYLHGRAGSFLDPAPGARGVENITMMARDGLRYELTAALREAATSQSRVCRENLQVPTEEGRLVVNFVVRPLTEQPESSSGDPLFLVVLERAAAPTPTALEGPSSEADRNDTGASKATVAALRGEVLAREVELHHTCEELKYAQERHCCAEEEMQTINEELQSTNEELETSREELQSVNEELISANAELQAKNAELTRTSNDMSNLLGGTGIATVFVDHDLKILRFTPTAAEIIHMIPGDVGRPVGHLASNLKDYAELLPDTKRVLDTLEPKEIQVQTKDGRWLLVRILPYRTQNNVVEGAVITFIDIDDAKRAHDILQQTQSTLTAALDMSQVGFAIADAPNGTLRYVNAAGLLIHGEDHQSAVAGVGIDEYVARWQQMDLDGRLLEPNEMPLVRAIRHGKSCSMKMIIRRSPGDERIIVANSEPIRDAQGEVVASIMAFMDITDLIQGGPQARGDDGMKR